MADESLRSFVFDYLKEIGASVREEAGVYTAESPAGRKRLLGKARRFTFEAESRVGQTELVDVGSPFLKVLLSDAKKWGALSAYPSDQFPAGSRIYTFQFEAFSSARKRSHFATAVLEPGSQEPTLANGVLPVFAARPGAPRSNAPLDVNALKEGLAAVLPAVERAGRIWCAPAVEESKESFYQSIERVRQYFQGMKQDTFLEEARIRKRLGEINSKLYFTEDGVRERKLQGEADRLTEELHALKKKNTQTSVVLEAEGEGAVDKQRRRHEPKLRIRLVAATLIVTQAPPAPAQPPAIPPAQGPPAPAPDSAATSPPASPAEAGAHANP